MNESPQGKTQKRKPKESSEETNWHSQENEPGDERRRIEKQNFKWKKKNWEKP